MFRIKDGKFLIVDGKFATGAPGTPCGCCGGGCQMCQPIAGVVLYSSAGTAAPTLTKTITEGLAPAQAERTITLTASAYVSDPPADSDAYKTNGTWSVANKAIFTDAPLRSDAHTVFSDFLVIESSSLELSSASSIIEGSTVKSPLIELTTPDGFPWKARLWTSVWLDLTAKKLVTQSSIHVEMSPSYTIYGSDDSGTGTTATGQAEVFSPSWDLVDTVPFSITITPVYDGGVLVDASAEEVTQSYTDPDGGSWTITAGADAWVEYDYDEWDNPINPHIVWQFWAYGVQPESAYSGNLSVADGAAFPVDTTVNDSHSVTLSYPIEFTSSGMPTVTAGPAVNSFNYIAHISGIVAYFTGEEPLSPTHGAFTATEAGFNDSGVTVNHTTRTVSAPPQPSDDPPAITQFTKTATTASGASIPTVLLAPTLAPWQLVWVAPKPNSWLVTVHGITLAPPPPVSIAVNGGAPIVLHPGETSADIDSTSSAGRFLFKLSLAYDAANSLAVTMLNPKKWHADSSSWKAPGELIPGATEGATIVFWQGYGNTQTLIRPLQTFNQTRNIGYQSYSMGSWSGASVASIVCSYTFPAGQVWERAPAAHLYSGPGCYFPIAPHSPVKICGYELKRTTRALTVWVNHYHQNFNPQLKLTESGTASITIRLLCGLDRFEPQAGLPQTYIDFTYTLSATLTGDAWQGTLTEDITGTTRDTVWDGSAWVSGPTTARPPVSKTTNFSLSAPKQASSFMGETPLFTVPDRTRNPYYNTFETWTGLPMSLVTIASHKQQINTLNLPDGQWVGEKFNEFVTYYFAYSTGSGMDLFPDHNPYKAGVTHYPNQPHPAGYTLIGLYPDTNDPTPHLPVYSRSDVIRATPPLAVLTDIGSSSWKTLYGVTIPPEPHEGTFPLAAARFNSTSPSPADAAVEFIT